jgi:hypothetical protein
LAICIGSDRFDILSDRRCNPRFGLRDPEPIPVVVS